jgi:hypothetical protein
MTAPPPKPPQEQGRPFTKEAAMAKYYASVVAQKASGQAIEWAGGVGFTRETGIEKVRVFGVRLGVEVGRGGWLTFWSFVLGVCFLVLEGLKGNVELPLVISMVSKRLSHHLTASISLDFCASDWCHLRRCVPFLAQSPGVWAETPHFIRKKGTSNIQLETIAKFIKKEYA